MSQEHENQPAPQHDEPGLIAELRDRIRAQDANEARMQFAVKGGGLGIWELDCVTLAFYTSAVCKANFGRLADQSFSYAQLRESVHPDDQARMQAAVEHSLRTGDDYQIVYRARWPDGHVAWVEVRGLVERAPDGSPLRMSGTSRDVTQAHQALGRTQLLLQLDGVFSVATEPDDVAFEAAKALGQYLGVSRAGYGTIDLAAETISIARDWNAPGIRTLAGVLQFREYGSYIEDLKRGTTVVIGDARLDPRTAATADALKAISAQSFINMPVTEADGLVALLYLNHAEARPWSEADQALVREVAQRTRMAVERRGAEKQLRALAETLEAQVVERTSALLRAEEALRQSQKMEAVGQLTGGLAHDFNNLLAGITGSLELVRRRVAEGRLADLDRYVGAGLGAAKRAAALTHRLLAFSRRQTLEPKALAVNKLIAGMEELIRRTMGPAVELEVVAAVGLWTVEADASQLENALLNLCINARDAMPEGGKLIIETANRRIDERSALGAEIDPGQYVSMCVSDNGVGMTPEVVARAFDPFFTTKPIGLGTGLGLSMIYGFAKQSGGHARIYSEPGKGTMVCVYLPRHLAGEPEADPVAADAQDPPTRHGRTVLVLDDEPTVRMFVVEVMNELGCATLEAADGPEAMRILESDARIDLLISDVGLPGGMNGRQVADAGRALRQGLRVLFITGYAENAVLSHGHLDPGMHVMTKPFELDTLARRAREIMDAA